MNNTGRLLMLLCIAGVVTWGSRQLPFLLFQNRKIPPFILYLGKVLPMAVMCILVLYCIKGISFESTAGFLPQLTSLAVVTLLHIWKRNTTLSIFAGTVCYMVLIRLL